jgi:hypothetical protein
MSSYRIEMNGSEPNKWPVVKFADIGYEDFVKEIVEIRSIVDAGTIEDPQRAKIKEAITSIVVDGLMPAFMEFRSIRASVGQDMPVMDRLLMYEQFSGKLWKSYKHLMRVVIDLMGYKIGFLFQNEKDFCEGIVEFRKANPGVRAGFEKFLEGTRDEWQNELAKFRNTWIEHQTGDRSQFRKFYDPKYAEWLFDTVWHTIADILPVFLELHLPFGIRLIEQAPNDQGPRWPQRFRYDHAAFRDGR